MLLRLGDAGPEVTALQHELGLLGFPLATDGVFGVRTDDAVRGFQLVVGLEVDGIAGPLTAAALAAGDWASLESNDLLFHALGRHERTTTYTTALISTALTAEVTWPHIASDTFLTPVINDALRARAAGWIDELEAVAEPVGSGPPNSIAGDLATTLLAPSLVGAAGILSFFIAGAAHPNPMIVTANLDLAADAILEPANLFMPGADWVTTLRNIVLLTFAPAPGIDPDPAHFQELALTPDGIEIHLRSEQVNVPFALGAQRVLAPWVKIDGVIRPSIVARAFGRAAGGPGPLVP